MINKFFRVENKNMKRLMVVVLLILVFMVLSQVFKADEPKIGVASWLTDTPFRMMYQLFLLP